MTRVPAFTSAFDNDEALWFPAHMSTGDSFAHKDGEAGFGDVGDGIGLPGRGGPRPPKKPGIKVSSWLWLTVWGVAAVGIVTVAARKEIAAAMTENWLKSQGVHAKLKFDQLSLSHLKGHIVIGDASNPEVSIDSFDTDYSLNLFGGGQPLARIRTLHLDHPVITVAFKGGQIDYGSLNKLIQDSLKAPPSSSPPPDVITVDNASVLVKSDYGNVHGAGSLRMDKGRLTFLTMRLPAAHLQGPAGEGDFDGGTLDARAVHTTAGDQLAVKADLGAGMLEIRDSSPVEDADAAPIHVEGLTATLDAHLPYGNSKAVFDALSGASQATLMVKADRVHTPDADMAGLAANLAVDGQVKLNDKSEDFNGAGQVALQAAALFANGTSAQDIRLNAPNLALSARLSEGGLDAHAGGPVAGDVAALKQAGLALAGAHLRLDSFAFDDSAQGVAATFKGGLQAGHLAAADLSLDNAVASLDGKAGSDSASGQWTMNVVSDLGAQGHYGGLHAAAEGQAEALAEFLRKPPAPGVPPPPAPGPDSIVALDRAFNRFTLRVSQLNVAMSGGSGGAAQMDVRLKNPVTIGLDGGGTAVLTPASGQPLLSSPQAGGFSLALDGPDLPKVAAVVSQFSQDRSGNFGGAFNLNATLNAFPVSGVVADGHGHFVYTSAGELRATLDDPAAFTADRAEIGDHLTTIAGTVSQGGEPLFVMNASGWRAAGAFHGVSLNAPNEVVAVSGGEGTFQAYSLPGSSVTGLKAEVTAASVSDAMPADQLRFNPLGIAGTLTQTATAMTGRFTATTPRLKTGGKAAPVADIALDADPVSGKGAIAVNTRDYLTFDPHGLQPVFLSPTVAAIFSKDVSGKASFTGGFTFDKDTSASSGVLKLDGLNFTGAAGVSQGLNGEIDFTSLTPLLSEPHQFLSIAHMQLGMPLDDLELRFQFLGDHLAVEEARITSPGGPVMMQPMTVPFDGKSPISGSMTFDGLDFGKIIAATGLADSMTFEGKLSGKLPFVIDGGHISFAQGFMSSDASGQISIKRQAVTGVQATGSVSSPDAKAPAGQAVEPAFNPFQDLAYQAMEYITYDQIDAKINSLPGGKLDVNFHIKGYFDPPQPQKARISLFDYVSGKWMQKPIKLPSHTPVELYLDVPVNLDEILGDLASLNVRTAQKPQ